MKSKNLLIFVGMPGSGKGEAVNVAKKLGYKIFAFGDIIREEVRNRKLPMTTDNVRNVSLWFHSGRDEEIVRRLEKKLEKTKTAKKFVILDGPRSPEELAGLKKFGFRFRIVKITAPTRVRYARQLARHRPDVQTIADAVARDKRELKYGIDKNIANAEKAVSNNCPMAEFRSKIKKTLKYYAKLESF